MTEHTPGPWTAIQCMDFSKELEQSWNVNVFRGPSNMPRTIAHLTKGIATETEMEANAHLIAAATDLLQVAQGCLGWLDHANKQNPPTGPDEAWLKPLRDAIAKATE